MSCWVLGVQWLEDQYNPCSCAEREGAQIYMQTLEIRSSQCGRQCLHTYSRIVGCPLHVTFSGIHKYVKQPINSPHIDLCVNWYCFGYTVIPQYLSENLSRDPSRMQKT